MSSHDDLVALHAEIRACRRCLEAGYEITPGPVFHGRADAQVMLIGQAPGPTEAVTKRPFNAGSGRRLFQWLGEAGWTEDEFRERAYLSAVTKCYPGRSATGKGDRVATPAEQALCRGFLEREIALINPRLLILVGGLAIKLLYPNGARLKDVIGTAVYFPPDTLAHPVNFNLADAHPLTIDHFPSTMNHFPSTGRFVVPLPHPSGASLWPNQPANQALIGRAVHILRAIRLALNL